MAISISSINDKKYHKYNEHKLFESASHFYLFLCILKEEKRERLTILNNFFANHFNLLANVLTKRRIME
jgi:hypothetical protein